MQLIARVAKAFISTHGVFTALLTTAIVHTALVYISTVGQSVHGVAFVAQTLKTTRRVHTRVITCPLKKALIHILTRAFICKQLKALSAVALKAPNGVPAEVIAATVIKFTLINVFACFSIRLQRKSNWTTAADTCRCVFTGAVTPPIVHCTCLHQESSFNSFIHLSEGCSIVVGGLSGGFISLYTGPLVRLQSVPGVTLAYRTMLCVLTGVLAGPIAMITRQDAAPLVFGQLEPWTTLTGHTPFGCLFADVGAAVLLIHTVEALDRSMDARVLVVTEEEPFFAVAFIAAHGIDTSVLAPTIVELTFVHVQAVVSIVCQMETIITSTSVIAWYVVAFMYTAPIVFQVTFIYVFTVFSVSFETCFTRALV